jgi:hypothetical protein
MDPKCFGSVIFISIPHFLTISVIFENDTVLVLIRHGIHGIMPLFDIDFNLAKVSFLFGIILYRTVPYRIVPLLLFRSFAFKSFHFSFFVCHNYYLNTFLKFFN